MMHRTLLLCTGPLLNIGHQQRTPYNAHDTLQCTGHPIMQREPYMVNSLLMDNSIRWTPLWNRHLSLSLPFELFSHFLTIEHRHHSKIDTWCRPWRFLSKKEMTVTHMTPYNALSTFWCSGHPDTLPSTGHPIIYRTPHNILDVLQSTGHPRMHRTTYNVQDTL